MTRNFTRPALAAAFSALLFGSGAALAAATDLPAVQKSGTVEYINGGVGSGQAHAMEKAGAQWPLTIVYAEQTGKHGDFVANVKTVIRDAKGEPVLSLDQTGPLVLANLEPGNYAVDATLGGKTLQRKVQVKKGQSARIEMLWPQGTTQ